MASGSNEDDRIANDPDWANEIGKFICEFIRSLIKATKLKPNRNVAAIIDGLGKHMEKLIVTEEGRRLLSGMKQLVSRITNKEQFLAILWRMFHVAGRICGKGSGRVGLFFMGTALLIFLLSTVTGAAEGLLAVWFTLAARTFALQLFASGSNFVQKEVKEAVPGEKLFANLLSTIVCGSGQQHEQVSTEEIQQLEIRFATPGMCSDDDWVLL